MRTSETERRLRQEQFEREVAEAQERDDMELGAAMRRNEADERSRNPGLRVDRPAGMGLAFSGVRATEFGPDGVAYFNDIPAKRSQVELIPGVDYSTGHTSGDGVPSYGDGGGDVGGLVKVHGSNGALGPLWKIHQVVGARIINAELGAVPFLISIEERITSGIYGRGALLIDSINDAHVAIDDDEYQKPQWSYNLFARYGADVAPRAAAFPGKPIPIVRAM